MFFFFLSAQNTPELRVQGLEIGAHDYISKPFVLRELTLKLTRILKYQKIKKTLPPTICHGKLKVCLSQFELTDAQGRVIGLSRKERDILELLYQKKGHPVTREEIIEKAWGWNKFPSNRTVDNYIVKLRKWADTDKTTPLAITSIRSVGYRLDVKKGEQ